MLKDTVSSELLIRSWIRLLPEGDKRRVISMDTDSALEREQCRS